MELPLSTSTSGFLDALDTFSRHALTRRRDLGVLIELARQHAMSAELDQLAFLAKFITRAHRIMQRIGKDGRGYDALYREFLEQVDRSTALLRTLLKGAPAEVEHRFAQEYLTLHQDSLRCLLALYSDLGWFKNWLLDHHPGSTSGPPAEE